MHPPCSMMACGAGLMLVLAGCESPEPATPLAGMRASNERHTRQFSQFDLPRRIGSVEHANLQLPVISPDGETMLYLRSDYDYLSLMTLLGSPAPQDTPASGTLAIWLRPVEGTAPGRRLSGHRWAHSPVWSDSGRSVAYVVNAAAGSFIVHHDLATGREQALGVPDAINCLPAFDNADDAVLFCSGPKAQGPYRIFRQALSDADPIALTPKGMDCVFPVTTDAGGRVFCARVQSDALDWVSCHADHVTVIASRFGTSARPAMLQTWFGITAPLSPGRQSWLFYDAIQDRISVCQGQSHRVTRHRSGSISACWLTDRAIALATANELFAVNTETGMSPMLFNGQWIPCRFVPATQRLLLLGKDTSRRFAIVEIVFKPGSYRKPPQLSAE